MVGLVAEDIRNLDLYARVLARFIEPEIMRFSWVGCRQRPKLKRIEAQKVCYQMDELQKRLEIKGKYGGGLWRLEMVGSNERPGSNYCDSGYCWILPLRSDRKDYLDYLAQVALPKHFQEKQFVVRSTTVPSECSEMFGL